MKWRRMCVTVKGDIEPQKQIKLSNTKAIAKMIKKNRNEKKAPRNVTEAETATKMLHTEQPIEAMCREDNNSSSSDNIKTIWPKNRRERKRIHENS